jgi:predicted PurR-regulated permease PerM
MDQPTARNASPPAPIGGDSVHLAIRLGLLAGLVYWSYLLVQPFIPILLWGAILTVALYPVHQHLARWLGGRPILSSIIVTLLSLAVVIGPASWLGFGLVEALRWISEQFGEGRIAVPAPSQSVKSWPLVGEWVFDAWDLASNNLADALKKFAPYAKPWLVWVLGVARSAGGEILKIVAAIILAGFLFIPGPRMVTGVRAFLAHVVPERSEEFVMLAGETIRSVSRGVIGIAMLQSLLAGLGFMIAEVPGAGLLTFIVLLLGIAQVGSAILLIPLIIWFWVTRDVTAATLFTLYIVPVGLLDNILKPIVMGRGSHTPIAVIVIGVIGGTLAHGILGLFIGPVVLAVGWTLLAAWMQEEVGHTQSAEAEEPPLSPAKSARQQTSFP